MQFVAFLEHVARTFPTVKNVIVGNEPNQSRFWQPQFDARGNGASGAAFEALLARSYDALKSVDPTINVIGVGLSPRGGDNPRASSNISTSPVKFIQGMGAAYRASGRTKPLMDQFAYHPYPKKDTDSLTEGYPWPNAGVTNLDRIKQAFWDAFSDTGQKTFEQGLRVKLDEVGWQVAVVPAALPAYFGAESIVPTTEAAQAAIYPALLRYVACDPAVEAVLFFGLQDEPNLDRWQAGLMRADGSARPSYASVKAELAADRRELRRHDARVAPLDDRRRCEGHVPEASAGFLARCTSGASSPALTRMRSSRRHLSRHPWPHPSQGQDAHRVRSPRRHTGRATCASPRGAFAPGSTSTRSASAPRQLRNARPARRAASSSSSPPATGSPAMSSAWHRTGTEWTAATRTFGVVDASRAAKPTCPVPGTTHVPFNRGRNRR